MDPQQGPEDATGSAGIGIGYPRFRLAKALRHAWAAGDERSARKVAAWQQVIEGMYSGVLRVGSRTPVQETPAWVTLEVVTGGFATGTLLAGGPLTDHERTLAADLGLPVGAETRAALNAYFLSEDGQARLHRMIADGGFRIDVPEEGALLVVTWLLDNGDIAGAEAVLDALMGYFDRLRFFPQPSQRPALSGASIVLQAASDCADDLRSVEPRPQITAQAEAIGVWTPLYDRAVDLLLETAGGSGGDAPSGAMADSARPCRIRPAGWDQRARGLLADYRAAAVSHRLCRRWHRRGKPFQRFLAAIEAHADGAAVSEAERTSLGTILADIVAKRGRPGSPRHQDVRDRQRRQCAGPSYRDVGAILADRLAAVPAGDGLADIAAFTGPITADEARDSVPEGTTVPRHFLRKVGRTRVSTIRELIDEGYISSADVLATVLPQITSGIRASSIADDALRRVYSAIYRAFRRRRSLLLLDYQSQVRLEELPWVAALDRHRRHTATDRDLAKAAMTDVVATALGAFPHAILPNKLLQELQALARQARIDMPLVDELAADIFMGGLSPKFTHAARIAGELLAGTLYERYYGIDYAEVRRIADRTPPQAADGAAPVPWWRQLIGSRPPSPPSGGPSLADYCRHLAGPAADRARSTVAAGLVIEQVQIVTTHNLAALTLRLDLQAVLGPKLPDLAAACFDWVCRRQQIRLNDYHSRLIMAKNTAYAWRQMIFFLSLLPADDRRASLAWMDAHLARQPAAFRSRFQPAMGGLLATASGGAPTDLGGRRFLGWTAGPHWVLSD